jgi:murein DD-endopeptidase MepM/ murein hydrolase activator NlpD
VRCFLALIAAVSAAATLDTTSPRQGDVIRITAAESASSARMNDRTVRLFRDGKNAFGLMPVPVLEKPGRYTLEILDGSGAVLEQHPVTVRDARFRRQNVVLGKTTIALKPAPGEMETMRAFRQTVTDTRHWDEPFAKPVPGCMTSPFGVLRYHNGKPTGGFHGGLDQRGPTGTPVTAVATGIVKVVRMWNIHGGTVAIDHGQGLTTSYLHLSSFATIEGATVRKGDVIGYTGTTGRSSAPHLHWTVSVAGVSVNPSQWVRVPPCAPARPKRR